MLRFVVALALALGAAVPAAAQDVFPIGVGDRWVFEVEGTTPAPDTLAAEVEWTVLDVRPSAEADTVSFGVERREADGTVTAATCRMLRRADGFDYLQSLEASSVSHCRSGGGFPFGMNGTTSYPFVSGPHGLGEATVEVGDREYTVETAEGRFFNSYSAPRGSPYWSTSVRVVLAEGIGPVAVTVIEGKTADAQPVNRDTLRSRLVGAEVGGQAYGALAVATGGGPPAAALRVGPNPARGTATVWLPSGPGAEAVLRVVDARGREVAAARARPGSAVVLDVGGLAAGVYAVRAEVGGEVARGRLVVVR